MKFKVGNVVYIDTNIEIGSEGQGRRLIGLITEIYNNDTDIKIPIIKRNMNQSTYTIKIIKEFGRSTQKYCTLYTAVVDKCGKLYDNIDKEMVENLYE